jgi:hypothetical protein
VQTKQKFAKLKKRIEKEIEEDDFRKELTGLWYGDCQIERKISVSESWESCGKWYGGGVCFWLVAFASFALGRRNLRRRMNEWQYLTLRQIMKKLAWLMR